MGSLEILLILIVALVIWGPKKIPEIARTLGKTVRALRKATSDITATVTRELNMDEKNSPPQRRTTTDDKTEEEPETANAESSNSDVTSPKGQ